MKFKLNGAQVDATAAEPQTPLLYVLRNDMQLNGPKFGCGLGQCGACAVLIDGKVARSCAVPLAVVAGRHVTTLEGLSPTATQAAQVQAAESLRAQIPRGLPEPLPAVVPPPTPANAEGGAAHALHPVQQAFVDEQAAQCGYCINGMIMALVALFQHQPSASDEDVRLALAGHLCRCGTHIEILRAAARARELIAQHRPAPVGVA